MHRLDKVTDELPPAERLAAQHQRIVDYVRSAELAMDRYDRGAVEQVLGELMAYADRHFELEEHFMAQAGYPMAEAHTQVHRHFRRELDDYLQRWRQGENVGKKLLHDVQIWLHQHIEQDDRDYLPYLERLERTESGWFNRTVGRLFGGNHGSPTAGS